MSTNYSKMKGPGDLPGNNAHPNSPDYDNEAAERAEEERSFWFSGLPAEKRADMLEDFIGSRKIGETWLCDAFDEYIKDSMEWEKEIEARESDHAECLAMRGES